MKNDPWLLVQSFPFSTRLPRTKSILFPTHLSLPLCLCQTALWAVASQVTWENRRQYIPAEHSFALRGFPPLSLTLSPPTPLFVFVHSCTVTSNSGLGLLFQPRHSSSSSSSFLCREITERMQLFFFVLKRSEPCIILHSWHKLSFHTLL